MGFQRVSVHVRAGLPCVARRCVIRLPDMVVGVPDSKGERVKMNVLRSPEIYIIIS